MGQPFNIFAAQVNPTVGDLKANQQLVLNSYQQAEAQKADLCLLPEAVLCGYNPADLLLRPQFIEDIYTTVMGEIVPQIGETALILSVPWQQNGQLYNAALVIQQQKIRQVVLKECLPNFSVMDEKRHFAVGQNNQPIIVGGVKIGLLICHDTWWPQVANQLKQNGAEMLLSINASPYALNKENFRQDFCKKRVQETKLPLLYLNLVGGQDEILFDGRSFTINPSNDQINSFAAWQSQSHTLTLQKDEAGYQFKQTLTSPQPSDLENIHQALKTGFGDYMQKCGFGKVVLGLSGGIDSALTAALAVEVLGAENVTGLLLPSKFTSDNSNDDALALAQNLGIQTHTLAIEETVSALNTTLAPACDTSGIVHENLQARVRGTLLMAYANSTGAMLLTTGNKSEIAVGFCTLYGDMNGGYNIIKDLYKTEVYALSRHLNSKSEIIPENIITKEPTPELSPNQKDSDRLPPYDVLDSILKLAIEEKQGQQQIVSQGYDPQTVEDILMLLKISEHKRYQSAPGPKLHNTAFGLDWRYPIANRYTL